jgi:small-conductance mechanosensitive channel
MRLSLERERPLQPMISISKEVFKDGRRFVVAVPAIVLVLCLAGLYLTRGSMANLAFLKAPDSSLVEQRPWQTIQQLAPLAISTEEQNYAQEATRLAAHEVDQAFAQAIHEANTQPKVLTLEAQALTQKVATLQLAVKSDQGHVDTLTPKPAPASAPTTVPTTSAAAPVPPSDDLEAAQTQLQLDSDELAEAAEDLATATNDKRAAIQQELAAHEATVRKAAAPTSAQPASQPGSQATGKTAIQSARSRGTLSSRFSAWLDQRSRYALVLQAKTAAETAAAALSIQHAHVEAQEKAAAEAASASLQQPAVPSETAPASSIGTRPLTRASRLQLLRSLSQEHALLDDRLQTEQQLAIVYGRWAVQVQKQHSIVLHLMLASFALIAFIILCAAIAVSVAHALVDRYIDDQRRVHTLRTIATLAIEVVSLLLILLVIFGAPSQVPTILGLATAGLTVVFQDFILAFFGWFILMGKHGIRIGDRVEINAIAGEVTEIGLFRTTLVETGNWNDKGHPTGRKVTFINNFAITGQFFNFSTVGQWMWDELVVGVPTVEATYAKVHAIRERVIADTGEESSIAIAEWQHSTAQRSLAQINASPSVDLRPSALGIDVVVRYITRAAQRYEMRNRIYQAIIDILDPAPEALPPVTEVSS